MSTHVKLLKVLTTEQIKTVVALADDIWREHYTAIIGEDQVSYMLKHFQSFDTINTEVQKNVSQYYLIDSDETVVGYVAIKFQKSQLFLSKIYVLSARRNEGIGRKVIKLLRGIASEHALEKISLTVNRNNSHSIAYYKKVGFDITGECCQDIGEGYVMDDFIMELKCDVH